MTVYEAMNGKDYTKIAEFIVSQPEENRCFASWKVGHPASTAGFIQHAKETRENYHIFWCEDENRKIRGVHSVEHHDTGFGWHVATNAFAMIDYKDLESGDIRFYQEMLDHMVRNEAPKYNVKRGEFWVAPHLVEWTKKVFNGAYEITREAMFMDQKLSFLIVDFVKYLELHP